MKKDTDGFPLCGENARCLGVRPEIDIPVDGDGNVKPCIGGMSVFNNPDKLPKHRKPYWMSGGEGRDPLFQFDQNLLPPDLYLRYHGQESHVLVEPANICNYSFYLSAIFSTRFSWMEIKCREQ